MKTRPEQIDTTRPFWEAFGHAETETSASYVVRFCQERGNWESFTYDEINAFYLKLRGHSARGGDHFTFNRLTGDRRGSDGRLTVSWIVKGKDDRFHITEAFVEACYKASPRRITAWARISGV